MSSKIKFLCSGVLQVLIFWQINALANVLFVLKEPILGLHLGFFPRFWRDSRFDRDMAFLEEVEYIFQSSFHEMHGNRRW